MKDKITLSRVKLDSEEITLEKTASRVECIFWPWADEDEAGEIIMTEE